MGSWSISKGKRSTLYLYNLLIAEFVKKDKIPGPGDYNLTNATAINTPAWKLSTDKGEKRHEKSNETLPGPGDYDSSASPVRKKQPQYTFAKPQKI